MTNDIDEETISSTVPEEVPQEAQQPLTALTLDDDPIDRLRLIKTCKKAGLQIEFTEVATVADMRRELDQNTFDIVFLDHNLGMETGLDALKALIAHEDQADTIPIMLTSVTSHHTAVEAMRNGCADYIVKEELTVSALIKSVTSAIERRILFSALSGAQAFQRSVGEVIERFMLTCGPEMREILSKTLATLRGLKAIEKADQTLDPVILSNFTLLERGCKDLTVLVDDLVSVVAAARGVPVRKRPLISK